MTGVGDAGAVGAEDKAGAGGEELGEGEEGGLETRAGGEVGEQVDDGFCQRGQGVAELVG